MARKSVKKVETELEDTAGVLADPAAEALGSGAGASVAGPEAAAAARLQARLRELEEALEENQRRAAAVVAAACVGQGASAGPGRPARPEPPRTEAEIRDRLVELSAAVQAGPRRAEAVSAAGAELIRAVYLVERAALLELPAAGSGAKSGAVGAEAAAGGDGGQTPDRLASLTPAVKKAWLQYWAEEKKAGGKIPDKVAYERVREGLDDPQEVRELPSFEDWSRLWRTARKKLGKSKNTPRAGRRVRGTDRSGRGLRLAE